MPGRAGQKRKTLRSGAPQPDRPSLPYRVGALEGDFLVVLLNPFTGIPL